MSQEEGYAKISVALRTITPNADCTMIMASVVIMDLPDAIQKIDIFTS
jgi:hypothetical protein